MDPLKISYLSNDELRNRLIAVGENAGPITDTVRKFYEKKLHRLLSGENKDQPSMGTDKYIEPTEKACVSNTESELKSSTNPAASVADVDDCFFAVSVSSDAQLDEQFVSPDNRIFNERIEALKVVKKIKGSRFKQFRGHGEARAFAEMPADQICPPSPACKPPGSPALEPVPVPAEGSVFKGPKIQELVKLRKAIERNDLDTVRSLVWANPRYLVSSGDTPTLLQEGFRYNSLHVAAMKNKPSVCSFLLDTLGDREFLTMLYPQDTPATCSQRMQFLTDLYLNMPDKGNNETPLHFACKFGSVEAVEVLVLHPQTDHSARNKNGDLPREIVCSRSGDEKAKKIIEDLLEGRCFVPLLRSDDNSTQAVIGEMWSPKLSSESPSRRKPGGNHAYDPELNVKAYAGPMTPTQAEKFLHQWKSPPVDNKELKQIRCTDIDKGLERIGRDIANTMGVPWCEYWVFLDGFVNMTHQNGLEKLEAYLAKRDPIVKQTQHIKRLDSELSHLSPSEGENSLDNLLSSLTACKLNDSNRSREGDKLLPNFNQSVTEDDSVWDKYFNTEDSILLSSPESSDEEYLTAEDDSDFDEKSELDKKQKQSLSNYKNLQSSQKRHTQTASHDVQLENRLQSLDLSPERTSYGNEALNSIMNSDHLEKLQSEKASVDDSMNNKSVSSYQDSVSSGDSVETYDSTEHILKYRQYRDMSMQHVLSSPDEKSSESSDESVLSPPPDGSAAVTRHLYDSPLPTVALRGITPTFSTPISQQKQNTFIKGNHPTKLDIDVLRSIENVGLDPDVHQHIIRWKNLVTSYSENVRSSWPSPTANKLLSRKTNQQVRNPWSLNQPSFSPLAIHSTPAPHSPLSRSSVLRPSQFSFSPRMDNQNTKTVLSKSFT